MVASILLIFLQQLFVKAMSYLYLNIQFQSHEDLPLFPLLNAIYQMLDSLLTSDAFGPGFSPSNEHLCELVIVHVALDGGDSLSLESCLLQEKLELIEV